MDTQLARVFYMLSTAAKLKKNNPEVSNEFIQKNLTYFPNETDRKFSPDKPTIVSKVKSTGFSNPELNIRKVKNNNTDNNKNNSNSNRGQDRDIVELNFEKKVNRTQQFNYRT